MRLPHMFVAILACLFSHITSCVAAANKAIDVTAMSFNLRVPVDPAPLDWSSRRHLVVQQIRSQSPDFFGVQEAVPEVVRDLAADFQNYAFIGRGREKGGSGEGTQIFYKSERWHLDPDDRGTLQLSPTPDVAGSNGWEMSYPRIFTWAHLIEKKSRKGIYVFNTHFPLEPKERLLSSALLARAIAGRKHAADPVILSGDFNACETEGSMQYFLAANSAPVHLIDSYRILHPEDKTTTFHGFGRTKDLCKIDYILISEGSTAVTADIIKDDPGLGFASDHYAVVAKLRLAPVNNK